MRGPERKPSRALLAAAAIAALSLTALPAVAQDAGSAAEEEGPRISVAEAVATTVSESLNLQQAAQNLQDRRGSWQQSTGTFDRTFFLTADFKLAEEELLRAGRDGEIKRRAPLEFLGGWPTDGPPFSYDGALDVAAEEIEEILDPDGPSFLSDCLEGQSPTFIDLDNERIANRQGSAFISRYQSSTVVLCLDESGRVVRVTPGAGAGFQGSLLFSDTPGLLDILSDLDQLDDETRRELEDDIQNEIDSFLDQLRRKLRATAADLRFRRERLGELPEVEELLDLKVDIGLRRKFRSGPLLTGSIALVGTEDNYVGKGYDPRDGDQLRPNTFTTSAGLRLEIPLGKGRGRTATAGSERASRAIYNAEQHLYVHEASKEALATVNAYWTLAAAQERVELLGRSARSQEEILEATRELVDAQELPGVELWRVEGRFAELQSQLGAAERSVIEARLDLLLAMGRDASTLSVAPLAAETLPGAGDFDLDYESWLSEAYAERRDLAAAAESSRAGVILEESARANLRRQFDFFANLSYSGYHESWTRDQRIWDISGYKDAVEGRGLQTLPGEDPEPPLPQVGMTGPSFTVGVKFTLPFRNLAAEGRLVRARSSRAQSQIAESDLERSIGIRLRDLLAGLERKREQLAALETAAENQQRTFDASKELFRVGDLSLIDTVKTEEELTSSLLQLVDLKLDVVLLENEARFEAGQLLVGPEDLDSFEPSSLSLAAAAGVDRAQSDS